MSNEAEAFLGRIAVALEELVAMLKKAEADGQEMYKGNMEAWDEQHPFTQDLIRQQEASKASWSTAMRESYRDEDATK